MTSLPRVVTVDPTGRIARTLRDMLDLIDRPVILADVPSAADALEEVKRGSTALLITAWDLHGDDIRGLELAIRAKQASQSTAVAILADVDDPPLDEETQAESPFVFFSRPVDLEQFLRVLLAGLKGEDIKEAMKAPVGQASAAAAVDMGPVPNLDVNVATTIVDQLLSDLGAMAIILSSRVGEVLMERGAVGYLDRERLTRALLPVVVSNIDVKEMVGGNATALQFYDGENYDVFVLSVGLHHFMCIAFDGEGGQRQFGAVSRYGRRAAEDLIALLGANAWMVQRVMVAEETRPTRKSTGKLPKMPEEEEVVLVRADGFGGEAAPKAPEPTLSQLEPIANLDLDKLFGQQVSGDPEDMFDLEKMEEIANKSAHTGQIGFDEAQQLGILPSS